jgi:alpha-mannosidase
MRGRSRFILLSGLIFVLGVGGLAAGGQPERRGDILVVFNPHRRGAERAEIEARKETLSVFNPLSWPRSGLVQLQVDAGTKLIDSASKGLVAYEVVEERAGRQTIRFWAKDVPSLGHRVYQLGRGQAVLPGRAEPETSVFQNKFYRVTLDPTRGAIKSLYDKELGRELVDAAGAYLLNEYLYVTGRDSEKKPGENEAAPPTSAEPHSPPADLTIHHAEEGEIVSVEKTPWGHVVRLAARAFRTPRIESEILLPDEEKRLEIRNRIRKDPSDAREAVYFAFPWAATNPVFRLSTANGWVDTAQGPRAGGTEEWLAAQNCVNVEDSTAALTLAVVDASLVSLGDISRGRRPDRFSPASAAVFSCVLNNYGARNAATPQSGEFVFRYAITSSARFDPEKVARFGQEARVPLTIRLASK